MKTKYQQTLGLLLLLLFTGLAFGVHTHAFWVKNSDLAFAKLATQTITPHNTLIFKAIATLGSPAIVLGATALLCLWLWYRRDLALAIWVGAIQLVGSAIAEVCKQLVARARPIHQLVADSGYSFPSGHTFCTTILIFTLLMLGLPRLHDQEVKLVAVVLGLIWVLLVAIARVYLRDHFASDVVGSMLLASGFWLVVTPYTQVVQTHLRHKLPAKLATFGSTQN